MMFGTAGRVLYNTSDESDVGAKWQDTRTVYDHFAPSSVSLLVYVCGAFTGAFFHRILFYTILFYLFHC